MKNKEANFQILKIAAMLMIVSHHLVAKNAFNIDTQVIGITGNKLALQILGNNAFIGNNLFFLVSAWFLSKKPDEKVDLNYSARSCWKIEKTVLFYGLSMCIGAFIFGGGQSKILLLQSVFPTLTGMWWYPTTYMIFLLIWPFYHKALMGFSVDVLKQFTTVMLVIWSVSTIVPFVNWGANNLLAFLMLYSIVILIKRIGITYETHKSEFKALVLIPYIVAVISIIVLDLVGKKISSAAEYSCYFMRGNYRPVSMMVSIGLFMWGTSWKIRTNKVIDYLAEATFGVYLFHMYPANMTYLFEKLLSLQKVIEKPYAVLWVVAVTAIIFVVGVAIDSLRKAMFYGCEFLTNWIRAKNNSACS